MNENHELSAEIEEIAARLCPSYASELSVAVIDLKGRAKGLQPKIAGYKMDDFIYPASVWKIFIAAEIFRKVDKGALRLQSQVRVELPTEEKAARHLQFFPSGSKADHRPALKVGDVVTLGYLLNLMLTRSDNFASNLLMALARREEVNKFIIRANGWSGSDVTDEYVHGLKAQPVYQFSKVTVSSARHLADFFYKVETEQLVTPSVSKQLKHYMQEWKHDGKVGLYLPEFRHYYCKGGWLEINRYKHGFWRAFKKAIKPGGYAITRWINDAGVVTGRTSRYAIAVLSRTNSRWPWCTFPIEALSREIHQLMESRSR